MVTIGKFTIKGDNEVYHDGQFIGWLDLIDREGISNLTEEDLEDLFFNDDEDLWTDELN